MKAVIYARYSSDNQREESIEGPFYATTLTGPCLLAQRIGRSFSG